MLRKNTAVALGAAAVLALAAAAVAQTNAVEDRFTFTPVNASQAGPTGEGRFEIVVNRWSPQQEREQVLSALTTGGTDSVARQIGRGWLAGYIKFPGNVEYTLRYAARVERSDGATDVVLATDRPIWLWWDDSSAPQGSTGDAFTVIQLRLGPQGTGVGKLSATAVTGDKAAETIALEDFANQRAVLTDVRRETT